MRSLRSSPGFVAASVLSLALGLAASIAVFGFFNAVLLRVLAVEKPEQLVTVAVQNPSGFSNTVHSYPLFLALRDGDSSISGFLARASIDAAWTNQAGTEVVSGELVSGNYFSLLGVPAAAGRVLALPDDEEKRPVCVLAHGFWTRRFGSSPDAVGRGLFLNGREFTVVGVARRDFHGVVQGHSPEIWVPLAMTETFFDDKSIRGVGSLWLQLLGRLRPGTDIQHAQARLQHVLREAATPGGTADRGNRIVLSPAVQGFASLRYMYGTPLKALMAIVATLLLVCALNVMILFMARLSSRAREMATRLALGSSRLRLCRDLLAEGLALSALAGLAGLPVAHWLVKAAVHVVPASVALFAATVGVDWSMIGITAVACLITGSVFSLGAALPWMRQDRLLVLTERQRAPVRARQRQALVAAQLSMAVVLVACALLFVTTLQNLRILRLGFEPRGLVLATMSPALVKYPDGRVRSIYEQLLEQLRSTPGVQAASLGRIPALSNQAMAYDIEVPGRPTEAVNHFWNRVTPGYFTAMGIPVLLGRDFQPQDQRGTPRVVIINQKMARHYWPGASPLGRQFKLGTDATVVGVVGDSKYQNVRDPEPFIVYTALWQGNVSQATVHVRSTEPAPRVEAAILRGIRALDKDLPVSRLTTMTEQIDELLVTEHLLAAVSTLLAGLAVVLVAIGLYGTVSYLAASRSREVGLRMALGARGADVMWLIAKDGVRVVAIGAAIGLVLSLLAMRLVSGLLFQTRAVQPSLLLGVVLLLVVVAVAGTLIPARRAARIDPAAALRQE